MSILLLWSDRLNDSETAKDVWINTKVIYYLIWMLFTEGSSTFTFSPRPGVGWAADLRSELGHSAAMRPGTTGWITDFSEQLPAFKTFITSNSLLNVFLPVFFFFFFFSFRATLWAYESSRAWGWAGATAVSLHHSHSSAGSKPHLQPMLQLAGMKDPYPTEQGQGSNLHLHEYQESESDSQLSEPQWELRFLPVLAEISECFSVCIFFFFFFWPLN